MRLVLVLGAVTLLTAACGGTKTVTVTTTRTVTHTVTTTPTTTATQVAACNGADLNGSFDVQPGSAGAGQITYTLKLTNTSSAQCFVFGIPEVQLLDANGAPLPTNQAPAQPGTQTAVRVVLQPGSSATADARFSPDVPGTGETQIGRCEPIAHTLRVTLGGSSLDAPINPPTSVCEHGSLRFSNLAAA
jgi:uncharacterized protein DUF4232